MVMRPDSTADVEIDESEGGNPEITVPISSTTEHRSGSRMTAPALEAMADQLQEGTVGLWDDHGLNEYGWPEYRREDMYGWWVDGYVEDETLYGTARLLDNDERTDSLLNQLEQGAPVGFSVGYLPLRDEWVEREEGETREILDVDLMEASPVGIPDNPDAVADGAARLIAHSLADRGIDLADLDDETADQIAAGVADALSDMTEETNEAGEEPAEDTDPDEQNDDEPPEQRQFSEDEVQEITEAVAESMNDHMPRMLEDIAEMLPDEDEAANDGDEGEDEDDDEEENQASAAVEELRSELDELREENENLQAKVDRLESETRDSEGRKGFSTGGAEPEETDDPDGGPESTDADTNPTNTLAEAHRLAGGQ